MPASMRARTLATTVEQRMRDIGLDQRELAERASVAPATVRQIQRGRAETPLASTLAKLSRALDWPADALIRVVSAVPGTDPADTRRDRTYEPPTVEEIRLLDRVVELEDELAALRRLVTRSLVDEGGAVASDGDD